MSSRCSPFFRTGNSAPASRRCSRVLGVPPSHNYNTWKRKCLTPSPVGVVATVAAATGVSANLEVAFPLSFFLTPFPGSGPTIAAIAVVFPFPFGGWYAKSRKMDCSGGSGGRYARSAANLRSTRVAISSNPRKWCQELMSSNGDL